MAVWRRLYSNIFGGNARYGASSGFGGSDIVGGTPITAEQAMRLSAVWSAMNIRAETGGTLPFNLRGPDKKPLHNHPLDFVLRRRVNAVQIPTDFFSQMIAHMDMHGNAVSIIDRNSAGNIVGLLPQDPDQCGFETNKSGTRRKWTIDGQDVNDRDVLHVPSFSMKGGWGVPRLDIGRQILKAQTDANQSAMTAFQNGLKVGGFFKVDKNPTGQQLSDFGQRMTTFARTENSGKWMTLLAGMEPVAGEQFRIKPQDAQLLESRYFGIEEICRLFNVPPPLIGHTSKASSWASSIENLNLFFLLYSLQPTLIRIEKHMEVKLLTVAELADGLQFKFSMQGLLRGDSKARNAEYTSGLQNGRLSVNEVRDMEDLPGIGPEGDVYRVQLNMANAEEKDDNAARPDPEDNDK